MMRTHITWDWVVIDSPNFFLNDINSVSIRKDEICLSRELHKEIYLYNGTDYQ